MNIAEEIDNIFNQNKQKYEQKRSALTHESESLLNKLI